MTACFRKLGTNLAYKFIYYYDFVIIAYLFDLLLLHKLVMGKLSDLDLSTVNETSESVDLGRTVAWRSGLDNTLQHILVFF